MFLKVRCVFPSFILLIFSPLIWPHGFVGKRFFPSAITQTEPFINDKLALPIYRSESPGNNGQPVWTTNPQLDFAKTLTHDFQVQATANYLSFNHSQGFDDWQASLRYNLFLLSRTETICSVGFNSKFGGSGSKAVLSDTHSTLSPQLLFAQGLGPLPESMNYLRPLAFSASFIPNIVTPNHRIDSVNWGLAVEYSLPYLNDYVMHSNSIIINHLVPIVEFQFTRVLQGMNQGEITATIDPGIIIYGTYGQVGLEAIIPSNRNTGSQIGGVLQFYLYLDVLLSK